MTCPSCGASNDPEARFCEDCGASLKPTCPACGTAYVPGKRFCKACGAALTAIPLKTASIPAPVELRVASVLFVDLVGYTSVAETRDAEDARELLSRYFDTARTIVDRYGGVIEKFIGDAVMTVWGAPTAREDDAERAVRAGLELVDAVAAFGEEVGAPQLRARAGVVTGQVASTASSEDALVVGDRVNTAARVQALAPPGEVYVDDVTRQASSAAIVYEDAGEHMLKGKREPVRLWRAARVVAGVAGAQREQGLEGPFVGRDSELRLVKDLFHATSDRGVARLVAVIGPPGVGKSRLRRELEHYVDGLLATVLWHSGRCLSYGDGVAYWALSEMVRQRLGIPEEAPPHVAEDKLEHGLQNWILDPDDREYLVPRLGVLLGTADPGLERQDLFAGWRLFFERLADHHPVVLAFEDLHWADEGLLDFIEHLLSWSAQKPIFVLGLARPELNDRRPGWAASRSAVTPIFLEPLDRRDIGQLLDGLVVDLPASVREQIADRAEGVPLYALETVRALADRGALRAGGDGRLVVTGDVGDIAMPPTLSALLTARLDALTPDERSLVSDVAVWGGSFTRASVAALSDLDDERVDAILASLLRKQVLVVRADPLSPDRGQYSFAQTLLRTVAYQRLSRRQRKSRHLAAAQHLRSAFPRDGEDVAEVIASHHLDAYAAAGDDPDAEELRRAAVDALRRAARRAQSVGAPEAAERAYLSALELSDDDEAERLALTESAAEMAMLAGRYEAALERLQAVADAHAAAGREREAARLVGRMGPALRYRGRNHEVIERLHAALDVLEADAFDADAAELNFELGTALVFAGRRDDAMAPLDRALTIAEGLERYDVLCGALTSMAVVDAFASRIEHARALLHAAIALAERHGLSHQQMRAQSNLGEILVLRDDPDADEALQAALATSSRLGDRGFQSVSAGNLMYVYLLRGRWDEIERLAAGLLGEGDGARSEGEYLHLRLVSLCALRGDLAGARSHLTQLERWRDTEDVEDAALYTVAAATVAFAAGDVERAFDVARSTVDRVIDALGPSHEAVRLAWPCAIDAAFTIGRLGDAAALVRTMEARPPGQTAPFLRAELARARGLVAAARGDDGAAEAQMAAALDAFAALGYPYWLARARLDFGRWLAEHGRREEASDLLDEAIATFAQLRAGPALARAREVRDERAAASGYAPGASL